MVWFRTEFTGNIDKDFAVNCFDRIGVDVESEVVDIIT
jgi:hypothetical protein